MCKTCNCVELPEAPYQDLPTRRGRKCLELLQCEITRQKLNGYINRIQRLRSRHLVTTEVLNRFQGLVGSALAEKNPCYYYLELQQLEDLLTSHGL